MRRRSGTAVNRARWRRKALARRPYTAPLTFTRSAARLPRAPAAPLGTEPPLRRWARARLRRGIRPTTGQGATQTDAASRGLRLLIASDRAAASTAREAEVTAGRADRQPTEMIGAN